MPIYEYQCEKCGQTSEITQKISDPPLSQCPDCGAAEVRKLVSRTSFQLKGGGWFADGYHKPASSQGATASGTGGKSSSSKPDSGD